MSSSRDSAYKDYIDGMKYKDIAAKYGVSLDTVKKWKTRYGWTRDSVHNSRTQKDKGVQADEATNKAKKTTIKAICDDETLTDKQRLFCIYWIKNKNATTSAIKAGYSAESAHVEGCRLLKKAKIREYINLFISEVKNNIMIDTAEIVERYMKIAFADLTDYVDFGIEAVPIIAGGKVVTTEDAITGEPIPILKTVNSMRFKESSIVDGGLICEISQGKSSSKIKLEDRHKALDWLAKYFLMNPMDNHKIEFDKFKMKMETELKGW